MSNSEHQAESLDLSSGAAVGGSGSKSSPGLARAVERWRLSDPHAMATKQSAVAIEFAFKDARHDILLLARQREELLAALQEVFSLEHQLLRDIYGSEFVESGTAAIAKALGMPEPSTTASVI